MIKAAKREHRILLDLHGWSGAVLGLMLYAIVATGTAAVLSEEIGVWSAGRGGPDAPFAASSAAPLGASVRAAIDRAPQTARDEVLVMPNGRDRMIIYPHRHAGGAEHGPLFLASPDGTLTRLGEGTLGEMLARDPEGALSRFLVETHVRLHVPAPWGFLLTGVAGMAMLIAALTGVVIHRHLIGDLFTLRRNARPVLNARDNHSLVASWSLPFIFLLAFTGCFYSFAASVGIPAVAMVAFGGDQEKLIETVIGAPREHDPSPADGADLDRIVADARARARREPLSIQIAHPGRADAMVTVNMEAADGGLIMNSLVYDGVAGRFLHEKPLVGRQPSIGGAAAGLMGPLHFGDFAGAASKLAWVALGLASCIVILTGLRLWLARRIAATPRWRVLERLTDSVGYGLPLAMATGAAAFFLALPAGTTPLWVGRGFLLGLGFAMIVGAWPGAAPIRRTLAGATGFVLGVLPLLRMGTGGPAWDAALRDGSPWVVSGDLLVLLAAGAFLAAARRREAPQRRSKRRSKRQSKTMLEAPAEWTGSP